MEKVVVAMSGGVDSSVVAALLKEEGYEVVGVTMQIWRSNKSGANNPGDCCGMQQAINDARRVAHLLDIPHYTIDIREVFAKKVIADFCYEYSIGRTPNPCIRCNQYIKFGALLEKAREIGVKFVATGHYAGIEYDQAGSRHLLRKGVDVSKDQSYMLYVMTQDQLKCALMPLGRFTKEKVRQMAQQLGLPVAEKPESQEICFIPNNDYPEFLKEYLTGAGESGEILDMKGNILGEHKGIEHYTIGQRRKLGISNKKPLYVIAIDRKRNAITVGEKENLRSKELIAAGINWIAIEGLRQPTTVKAKIRYHHREVEAEITPWDEDRISVKFKESQMAITPGQAVVFYDRDIVLGGGTIDKVLN